MCILREADGKATAAQASVLPSNVRGFARLPRLLYITKADSRSTVQGATETSISPIRL
jgi:hypothetical protein